MAKIRVYGQFNEYILLKSQIILCMHCFNAELECILIFQLLSMSAYHIGNMGADQFCFES